MQTRQMATVDGTPDRSMSSAAAQWSNLPDDLLGMVRCRVASLRDRVLVAAVCKPWRTAMHRLPAPPSLPMLLLSPHSRSETNQLYCPASGGILRFPSRDSKGIDKLLVGCHDGGWIATFHDGALEIGNLFTGAEVPLSATQSRPGRIAICSEPFNIAKIVFSEAPTSPRCVMAAVSDGNQLATCRIGRPDSGWTVVEKCGWIPDVAFCKGDLYGLTPITGEIRKLGIDADRDGAAVVTSFQRLGIGTPDSGCPSWWGRDKYIVELHGEMALVVKFRSTFVVIKLVTDGDERWVLVTDLGDCALFLGPVWCKAVPVPADGCGGVERNHIYYSNDAALQNNLCYARYRRPPSVELLPSDEAYLMTLDDGGLLHYYCSEEEDPIFVKMTGYYVVQPASPAIWLPPPDL